MTVFCVQYIYNRSGQVVWSVRAGGMDRLSCTKSHPHAGSLSLGQPSSLWPQWFQHSLSCLTLFQDKQLRLFESSLRFCICIVHVFLQVFFFLTQRVVFSKLGGCWNHNYALDYASQCNCLICEKHILYINGGFQPIFYCCSSGLFIIKNSRSWANTICRSTDFDLLTLKTCDVVRLSP